MAKNQTNVKNTEVKDEATVQTVLESKAEQTKKNLSQGGTAVKVSIVNTTEVIFTADYGYMKKGHKQRVSDLALEMYQKAGVVERL